MNCWRCGNETTKDDLPHLCQGCQKILNPTTDPPDELTIHVKNNGKPKTILIDADGTIRRLTENKGDAK